MTAKNIIILPANLQIANVADYRDKAIAAAQTGKDVTLKAADTVRVDTAGLQLLLALQTAVTANGKSLKWEKVSDELHKCFALLGVSKQFHY